MKIFEYDKKKSEDNFITNRNSQVITLNIKLLNILWGTYMLVSYKLCMKFNALKGSNSYQAYNLRVSMKCVNGLLTIRRSYVSVTWK